MPSSPTRRDREPEKAPPARERKPPPAGDPPPEEEIRLPPDRDRQRPKRTSRPRRG